MGKKLNLDNPKTFNEKLQWLKLYNRKPEYTTMVDKVEVKDYIAKTIGEEYVIPTLGVWENADDIDFDKLPEQFVLKCNHDSGSIVICKDKSKLNKKKTVKFLNKRLGKNGFWYGREWPYNNIKPLILAEQYIGSTGNDDIRDYKFFCFNGKAEVLLIAADRQNKNTETTFDFFDMEFNHLPFVNGHCLAKNTPEKPKQLDKMIGLAEKLSNGIPHVRVDFYEVDGKILFGELTFFHWSGFCPFEPENWDCILGDLIELPPKSI